MNWFQNVVASLNAALFTVGNEPVSWASIIVFTTSLATIGLAVTLRVSNFAFNTLNSGFAIPLAAAAHDTANLLEASLFVVLGGVGWWLWLRGGPGRSRLAVGWAGNRQIVGCVVFIALAAVGLTALYLSAGNHYALWNGLLVSVSIAAQFLLNAKRVQTWILWMITDFGYVPLLVMLDLRMSLIVYTVSGLLCLVGLRLWLTRMRAEQRAVTPVLAGSSSER